MSWKGTGPWDPASLRAALPTTIHQAATASSCIISGQSTDEMYLVTGVQCGKQHRRPCGRTINVFVFGFHSAGTKEPERERWYGANERMVMEDHGRVLHMSSCPTVGTSKSSTGYLKREPLSASVPCPELTHLLRRYRRKSGWYIFSFSADTSAPKYLDGLWGRKLDRN